MNLLNGLHVERRNPTLSVSVVNQGDEADCFAQGDNWATFVDSDELKLLGVVGSHGDDHASAFAQLGDQSSGKIGRGGGDENCVEGSDGGKADAAVCRDDFYVGVAEARENLTSAGS